MEFVIGVKLLVKMNGAGRSWSGKTERGAVNT